MSEQCDDDFLKLDFAFLFITFSLEYGRNLALNMLALCPDLTDVN